MDENTLDTSGVSHVPDCDRIINRMLMKFRAWRVRRESLWWRSLLSQTTQMNVGD